MNSAVSQNVATCAQRDMEQLLSTMWAKYLFVERVGPCDDFFVLGGSSLTMIAVIEELLESVRGDLRPDLVMQAFFEAPTVRALAAYISAAICEEGLAASA